MEGSMEKTNKMLAFLHPIIEEADPELEDFLIRYVLNNFHLFGISFFFSLFVVHLLIFTNCNAKNNVA